VPWACAQSPHKLLKPLMMPVALCEDCCDHGRNSFSLRGNLTVQSRLQGNFDRAPDIFNYTKVYEALFGGDATNTSQRVNLRRKPAPRQVSLYPYITNETLCLFGFCLVFV